jgi:TRAP-type C4-dicarboxylate transport system permease large subunit
MLILVGVGLLGYFFAATRLPFELAGMVTGLHADRHTIFACVVLLYIVLGCLVNVIPMMLLTMPAIFPTIEALRFDPVWFGVVTVIMLEMGQITPPVGINVFALASVARDVPMVDIFRRTVPFFFAMLVMVLVLTCFPILATWLPDVFYGSAAPS